MLQQAHKIENRVGNNRLRARNRNPSSTHYLIAFLPRNPGNSLKVVSPKQVKLRPDNPDVDKLGIAL